MSDRQDDLNPASDLAPFADALKRLAPQPAHLSRDALLFEAGKAAAAPRLAPWVWPSAAGLFAGLSIVLTAFLIAPGAPGGPPEEKTVYVYLPQNNGGSTPGNRAESITPPSPEPERKQVVKASPEPSETARLLKQKQDVLRWGLDMLPESKPNSGGPSADVTAREVTHWLKLPPGTFAVNPTAPEEARPERRLGRVMQKEKGKMQRGKTKPPMGRTAPPAVRCLTFFLFPFSFFLSAPTAQAQDQEPKPAEYQLTLRLVGPPLPSFKYELVPARDLVKNNAALLWHRALHILAEARRGGKEYYETQQKLETVRDQRPLGEFPKDEVRTFLKPFTNVFKEMEAAARCDSCDWGTDERIAAEGVGFLLPDAQKMRELASLLSLRARLHAAEGKVDLALRDVQTGYALARGAAQGPTFIHFLIGIAVATQMTRELEQVMQVPGCPNLYWSLTALPRPLIDLKKPTEGELRGMEATIPIPKDVDKGPMTPEGALAALDQLWAGIQKLSDEPDRLGIPQSRLALAAYITLQHPSARKSLLAAGKTEAELDAMPPAQVVMLDSLARFRNVRDEHYVWFNAPYAEAMQGMRRSEARIHELKQGPPFDFLQTTLLLLLPAVEKVYSAEVRMERRIASLRAVEAVRLYAAKHDGKLPATLAEVSDVPVPVDPATGQLFEYAVEGDRFTINVPLPPGARPDQSNAWKYVVTLAR